MIKYMQNRSKRNSEEDSENAAKCCTNKGHNEYVEWWEAKGLAHNERHHDIPFYLLEEDVETNHTTNSPDAHFRTHDNHEKRWNKCYNRAEIRDKFHSTSDESKWKYMINWETKKLSNKESYEIDSKHEDGEKKLTSEPCMNSIGYSSLPTTEIMTQIRRENSKKPSEEDLSFKYDKKCEEYKERKSRHRSRHTRSKWETHSRDLSDWLLNKISDKIYIANESVHDKLCTIFIHDKCSNTINIHFIADEITEIKWEAIYNRKVGESLLFKCIGCIHDIYLGILSKTNKNRNNRDEKQAHYQK